MNRRVRNFWEVSKGVYFEHLFILVLEVLSQEYSLICFGGYSGADLHTTGSYLPNDCPMIWILVSLRVHKLQKINY